MEWDWNFAIYDVLPKLLEAMIVTIEATIGGFSLAAILGLLFALGRRSENKWLSRPLGAFVEFIRTTPLLVQLFFFFFVLPRPPLELRLPALVIGIIALGLHYGTYCSEVYRAGIDAVAKGQWEAATALNFSPTHIWTRIILPQAIPPMIPALGNYFVAMFKETPQLAAITVTEMLLTARIIGTNTFRFLEPITMVGLLFFLLSYPSSLIVQRLEARYAQRS